MISVSLTLNEAIHSRTHLRIGRRSFSLLLNSRCRFVFHRMKISNGSFRLVPKSCRRSKMPPSATGNPSRSETGGDGFGTQTQSRCIGWRKCRNAGSAHRKPTSKRTGIHAVHASSAASSTKSNNHRRISVFTRSSAENDILFTNVNAEIHKNN